MKGQFTLTPEESKRLIAKGVRALPSVQRAFKDRHIIVAGGMTNAYVLAELVGEKIEEKSRYTVGIITNGETGETEESTRIPPYVIENGKAMDRAFHWKSYLPELKKGDVFIKGGNAIDHTGLVAVLAGNPMGGTIGAAWGPVMQRGIELIVPIGLEKLVPDVREAVEFLSGNPVDEALGEKVGLMPLPGARAVTEITALELLYQVQAKCIAAGGALGSEGAVVLVIEGKEERVKKALEDIRSLKNK